ncbi:exosortase A [Aurantiacibacter suaedae]|uniref:exosortase A n=1 Tax=Aurantiacibacter suaedae TaxID=2545755 RepID=UPI001F502A65|nr:exosortase A [Aurantiacibacter suaedae]
MSPTRAPLTESIAPQWRVPLLQLSLGWAAMLALFAGDWAAMAAHWWNTSTYNHILLIPAIIAWLVWQRLPELARLTPRAWWPGLVALGGALLVWLLGNISGLATASQLGAVAMLPASVLALLGPRVSYALLFPLFYSGFLVPIGEELVPVLQMITADITIALTHLSGIPAEIEGVFIDTPVGLFEVAEACSGVKFLVAMVALGALIANQCFRSVWRRMAFMAACVIVPILANGVRAWGTIYIAQFQGIEFAAGFDHVFYGWIFFAVVMAILIGAGWRFFDRGMDEPAIYLADIEGARWIAPLERFIAPGWAVLAGIAALALTTTAWASAARAVEAPLPQAIALPQVAGWEQVPTEQAWPWRPHAPGADRRLFGSYRSESGQRVDVFLAFYGAQEEGREAGAYGEGAQPPGTEWRWLGEAHSIKGGKGEQLQAVGLHPRLAMTWYRHGDWTGSSRLELKALTMRDRLLFTARPTATMIVSAEGSGDAAEAVISDFIGAIGPSGKWMDRIVGLD